MRAFMQNATIIRSSWKYFTLIALSIRVHCQILEKGNRKGKLREKKNKRIKIDVNIKMLETLERISS